MAETPEGMHRMQYAVHILEEVLCWPSKGNAELMADCILALCKGKKLSEKQAHDYLVRAIRLAKSQEIKVDRFWFQGGEYTHVRPSRKEAREDYKIDRTKTEQEQETEEWLLSSLKARQLLAQIAAGQFQPKRNSKDFIKQQAAELMKKRGTAPTAVQPEELREETTESTDTRQG